MTIVIELSISSFVCDHVMLHSRNSCWTVHLRAVVRENRGFLLKFGKCDLTDFDETLHNQSTLRINNFPEIIDFFAKRLPW